MGFDDITDNTGRLYKIMFTEESIPLLAYHLIIISTLTQIKRKRSLLSQSVRLLHDSSLHLKRRGLCYFTKSDIFKHKCVILFFSTFQETDSQAHHGFFVAGYRRLFKKMFLLCMLSITIINYFQQNVVCSHELKHGGRDLFLILMLRGFLSYQLC